MLEPDFQLVSIWASEGLFCQKNRLTVLPPPVSFCRPTGVRFPIDGVGDFKVAGLFVVRPGVDEANWFPVRGSVQEAGLRRAVQW